MTEENETMRDKLIALEQERAAGSSGIDPTFERLLEDESRFEARLRKIAVRSWALAFGCLVLLVVAMAAAGDIQIASNARVGDVALLLLVPTGTVAFFSGTLTSITWLFRSRTPTLRAISRRLNALENRLSQR